MSFTALTSSTDMTENTTSSPPAATAPEVVTSSLTSSPASAASASAAAATAGAGESTAVKAELCAGCRQPITERYLLRALDSSWHEDCLRCSCCDCRLGEVGSTLFTRSNLLLCRRDYLRSVSRRLLTPFDSYSPNSLQKNTRNTLVDRF